LLARPVLDLPQLIDFRPRALDLDADELAARVLTLVQPVGKDQADVVVLGVLDDGLKESLHCSTPFGISDFGTARRLTRARPGLTLCSTPFGITDCEREFYLPPFPAARSILMKPLVRLLSLLLLATPARPALAGAPADEPLR